MFKFQVKGRDKKVKCTCISQVRASAYAYLIFLLYCNAIIIMIEILYYYYYYACHGNGKWLLKVTSFEKYVFKLKIEPVSICICPCFHK